jgi:hypothetical protein
MAPGSTSDEPEASIFVTKFSSTISLKLAETPLTSTLPLIYYQPSFHLVRIHPDSTVPVREVILTMSFNCFLAIWAMEARLRVGPIGSEARGIPDRRC